VVVAVKKAAATKKATGGAARLRRAEAELRKFALAYPGAWEDHPWGENVVKIQKKVFAFFHVDATQLSMSFKLPESGSVALGLPFTEPTGYGLGKSGWVTSRFGPSQKPPVDVLKSWIDESYRAVAPRKLKKL
jgi:predicted DNA-binding protein (MmcQ/YjbR family)